MNLTHNIFLDNEIENIIFKWQPFCISISVSIQQFGDPTGVPGGVLQGSLFSPVTFYTNPIHTPAGRTDTYPPNQPSTPGITAILKQTYPLMEREFMFG